MAIRLESKRPGETINYELDWSEYLGEDTIDTSTVDSDDVTVTDVNDTTAVTLTISGGTEGTLARIENTIVTAAGLSETEVLTIFVSEFPEPVGVNELKEQLAILNDNSRDNYIASLGRAAREYAERRTKHIAVRRQFTETFASIDNIAIFNGPLISVDEISYTDVSGVEQLFEDVTLQPGYPGSILNTSGNAVWPAVHDNGIVTVVYTAGYAEGETPETMIQAIKMLVAHWFDNRTGILDRQMEEAPLAVNALLDNLSKPSVM